MKSKILQENLIDSPNFLVFVSGSWEIGDPDRNLLASEALTETGLTSTLLYESFRDWEALQHAESREDWKDAFGDKTYLDELDELKAVIGYVRQQHDPKNIYLSGSSYGGGLVVLALGPLDINNILLAAPEISIPDEHKTRIYSGFPDSSEFLRAIRDFQGRLRIIFGEQDERVPFEHSSSLYSSVRTKDKRLTILPGDHTFSDNIEGYVQEHLAAFR